MIIGLTNTKHIGTRKYSNPLTTIFYFLLFVMTTMQKLFAILLCYYITIKRKIITFLSVIKRGQDNMTAFVYYFPVCVQYVL